MAQEGTEENCRYQLRRAAGLYWILDMEQEGVPYRKPVPINEPGADIWKLQVQGYDEREIAEILCKQYEREKDEVLADVLQFRSQLEECGIFLRK